jgi:hypothetical protein
MEEPYERALERSLTKNSMKKLYEGPLRRSSMKEQLQVRSGRLREVWGGPGGGENKKAGAAGKSQNTEARANADKDPGP